MKRKSLYFTGQRETEVREEDLEPPGDGEVLVETEISSVSAGSELLFYRNQIREGSAADKEIANLKGNVRYPLKYGYSCVGRVKEIGEGVQEDWADELVFSFNPHESHFVTSTENLISIPEVVADKEASFLPNVETAVNLLMDGRPMIGEDVIVLGQGVVGLLTTSLLDMMPLNSIVTSDRYLLRRETSKKLGADASVKAGAGEEEFFEKVNGTVEGADLTYELSGDPKALEKAIDLTGFDGRIVVGSWYGDRNRGVTLGTEFHRNRIDLISSQVSSINPRISGRWTKSRRLEAAWDYLERLDLESLITHEFTLSEADKAYRLLDGDKGNVLQVIFRY